jgi:hypothetical protein
VEARSQRSTGRLTTAPVAGFSPEHLVVLAGRG